MHPYTASVNSVTSARMPQIKQKNLLQTPKQTKKPKTRYFTLFLISKRDRRTPDKHLKYRLSDQPGLFLDLSFWYALFS